MHIRLVAVGRRYNRDWIFRHINRTIASGTRLAITGGNGSGKSTILQVLSGYLSPSEGKVEYRIKEQTVNSEEIFLSVALASPYITVHEEMTVLEAIQFHFGFKQPVSGLTMQEMAGFMHLEDQGKKQIKVLSSGMKQRLRLGLAIGSAAPLLLLDEPATNLDANNIKWYRQSIELFGSDRTIVICSNRLAAEMDFCSVQWDMDELKG